MWNGLSETAFKNINLSINQGEFIALLGPNGCGKSTLAKHFNGLLLPTYGDVFVNGINTKNEEKYFDLKQKVGMIFQNPDNQIVASVVEEEIAFGLENIAIERNEMKKRIKESLKIVGLPGFEKKAIYSLSGGQKQLLAIASVLAMKPEILVLDEPTSMLSPESRKGIINVILNLNKKDNMTILLVTHFIEEALLADKAIIMDSGEIVSYAKPEEIFSDAEFIKSKNFNLLESTQILYFLKENGYDVSLKVFDDEPCANEIIKLLENHR